MNRDIFHSNLPNRDPVEELEYMESCVSKRQFILMQFIKIYILLREEGTANPEHILRDVEKALIGKKVDLKKQFIRDQDIPTKIKSYFYTHALNEELTVKDIRKNE